MEELINWKPIVEGQVQEMKDMLDEFQAAVLKMDNPMAYVKPVKNTVFQATMYLLEQATEHRKKGATIIQLTTPHSGK